jgi:glucosyl-3-phosphoglycerate synthase
MSDFFQNGYITTLHNLSTRNLKDMESELAEFALSNPMGLILPSLYSELQQPALTGIVEELRKVGYLEQIVIGIDQADEQQYRHALEFFSVLPQNTHILWNDGPRLRAIDTELRDMGIAPTEPGKGRNVWYCMGYMMALDNVNAIALHDCDIKTYHRSLLARLLYPVANPAFNYDYCKGYYPRLSSSMGGRVARLLVTPLVRAMNQQHGPHRYLDFLDSFRYPLAGEFSMKHDVMFNLRMPTDWGLEVGLLLEMKKNYATSNICQVDIADNYDHKHQDVSAEDRTRGLSRMAIEISKTIYKKLATDGLEFSEESMRTTKATYYRIALDLIESYRNDCFMNGLEYETHVEENLVEMFAENIKVAGMQFLEDKDEAPFIPSWRRIRSAVPDVFEKLRTAVDADMKEYS